MPITAVTARAVYIPLKKPTRISTRILNKRDFVIVTIRCDESDAVGIGYSYLGTAGGRVAATAVEDLLAPVLLGADANDIQGLWDRLFQETLLTGRRGVVVRAIAAVDMALWDLAAKRRGMPISVMLGGSVRPVPAYASGGYYRPDDGPWADAVRDEIRFNVANGFTDHKIKVGGLSIEQDAERVRAAIEAMEGRGRLGLDANNAYRDFSHALEAARAFERAAGSHGLWWFEEPLSPEDYEGHARLSRVLETRVATGEIHQTRHEFRRLLEERSADLLQPDMCVLGGVTEWLRIAKTAETFGIGIAPHWHANAHAPLAAAAPNCIAVEHFILEKDIYNFETIVTPQTRLRTGENTVLVPDAPGFGTELDEDKVNFYSVAT
ncbi:galactonate dehydratase [Aquamicrobium terrae]